MSDPSTRDRRPDATGGHPAPPDWTQSAADPNATTGGDPDTAPAFQLPDTAGRYVLGDELARGGMGVVYRATDTALGREVAVKVLSDRFAPRSGAARRFLDEARITGQLQHPGIPPVHDLGTLPDGRPFLAMKLIDGQTLDDLLKGGGGRRPAGPPSHHVRPADAGRPLNLTAVFESVCQAVAYAHAHGVIHRDLKPQNVMVGAFGEVQVMDWGLAKVLADHRPDPADPNITGPGAAVDETQAGAVLGTAAYMPPEQARGAVGEVDRRSDVFGLGAVLCAILTGRPPFAGDSAEDAREWAARGQVGDALARLDGCGADPELVALCKQCLRPEPAGRPADAAEVAGAVARLRAAADERARRAEADRAAAEAEAKAAGLRAAEQRKRRRVELALAASVTALLLGGGAFGWWADRQEALRESEAAARGRDEQARRARDGDALAALLGRCEDALRADDPAAAAAALAEAERRAAEGVSDGHERLVRCRGDVAVLRGLDAADTFRWTPTGNYLPDERAVGAAFREALAGYAELPPAAAAARAAGSPTRERLLAALDLWLAADPDPWARAVLRAADPDPFREAVRDAVAAGDGPGVAGLAARPEALTQPGRFAAALGGHPAVPAGRRREVLARALRSRPGDPWLLMTMGRSYRDQRTPAAAAAEVRWFQAAVAARPASPGAHVNLGHALAETGDPAGAVASYREAVRLDPGYSRAHNNLGVAVRALGCVDEAIACFREAVRLDPVYPAAHVNLGQALEKAGDPAGAVASYREAVRLDPGYSRAHNNLAWLLATGPDRVRDGRRAVEHAAAACKLTGGWADFVDTLAAAHAEAGEFDRAVELQREALASPAFPEQDRAAARHRLDLYAAKRPYRDPAFAPREVAPPPRPAGR